MEVTIATENTNAPVREADGPRINKEIRAKEVRLINYNGENLGVVSIHEALKIAEEVGLDLIEISPQVQRYSPSQIRPPQIAMSAENM